VATIWDVGVNNPHRISLDYTLVIVIEDHVLGDQGTLASKGPSSPPWFLPVREVKRVMLTNSPRPSDTPHAPNSNLCGRPTSEPGRCSLMNNYSAY
jgi:hypothetical protein